MATVVALAAACTTPPAVPTPAAPASAPSPPGQSADERAEFQQEILSDLDKVGVFLQKTDRGVDLTGFSLGWFSMVLLTELSSCDQELYDRLHADGMNVELYLRNTFKADPIGQIAIMNDMAARTGSPIQRAARDVLLMLTKIPNTSDSPETQAAARQNLAAALRQLQATLTRVAEDAASGN